MYAPDCPPARNNVVMRSEEESKSISATIPGERNRLTYDEIELTKEQAQALAELPVHDDIPKMSVVPLGDPASIR